MRKKKGPLVVKTTAIKVPIARSPGFEKKQLSEYKLDAMGLCQYGCRYCSSNSGNYLRINRERLAELTEEQLGERYYPSDEPRLTFEWTDIIERLEQQLAPKTSTWGTGQTLVYSMLTDGFSPMLVGSGSTKRILELVLNRTGFRIRVLTKNAVVGSDKWLRFFEQHRDRFVVGLSIGSLDDGWSKKVECFTPPPSRRLNALRRLQDAGIPTYGMLCPVFPDVLEGDRLEELIDGVRPALVEHIWAEPYNDRHNWTQVRNGYEVGSFGYDWITAVYENRRMDRWSEYATDLYLRLRTKAIAEGWLPKLRYLLYELTITRSDAERIGGLQGVLLQSKPASNGKSQNEAIAILQSRG
jgi:DNA repair photolyase